MGNAGDYNHRRRRVAKLKGKSGKKVMHQEQAEPSSWGGG